MLLLMYWKLVTNKWSVYDFSNASLENDVLSENILRNAKRQINIGVFFEFIVKQLKLILRT